MLGEERRRLEKEAVKKERIKLAKENKPATAAENIKAAVIAKDTVKTTIMSKTAYCRFCQQQLKLTDFFSATNPYIDKNGKMSVCIGCIQKIYERYLVTYQEPLKSMYCLCQDIDWAYDEDCVNKTLEYMKQNPNTKYSFIAKYKNAISTKLSSDSLRFKDSKIQTAYDNRLKETIPDHKADRLIVWGQYSDLDYEYLESVYNEYVNCYGANSPAERDNFRILAILRLNMRNNPTNKDCSTALNAQYKACGITPEQIEKKRFEKGARTFGVDILTFEMEDPIAYIPQWEKASNRYKDYDGLDQDMRDNKRSAKNYFTQSSDFNSKGVDISLLSEDTEDIEV